MHPLRDTSATLLALAGLMAPAGADGDPLTLIYEKAFFEPNEVAVLNVFGTPGTLGVLLFDSEPGPTLVPGVGLLEVGLSDSLILFPMPPVPAEGQLSFNCGFDCDSAQVGKPIFTQAVSLDLNTFLPCVSNSDVLLVLDVNGVCMPPCSGSLGDFVFEDLNDNDVQDPGEPGIGGVVLVLEDGAGNVLGTTTTDGSGFYQFTELCAGSYVVRLDPGAVPGGLEPVLCEVGGDPALDSDCSPAGTELTTDFSEDPTLDFGFAPCGPCDGKVTALTLRYLGAAPALVAVEQSGDPVFEGTVDPLGVFTFFGTDGNGTLGKEIEVFVDGSENVQIHTSCSKPIGPGLTFGDFEVVSGRSLDGGLLCDLGDDVCNAGKPATLTMTYTGEDCSATSHDQDEDKVNCSGDPALASPVHIVAFEGNDVFFDGMVDLGSTFVIDAALAGEDDLKSKTFVDVFDATGKLLQSIEFHTSCSQPLLVGDQFGSLRLDGFTPKL